MHPIPPTSLSFIVYVVFPAGVTDVMSNGNALTELPVQWSESDKYSQQPDGTRLTDLQLNGVNYLSGKTNKSHNQHFFSFFLCFLNKRL